MCGGDQSLLKYLALWALNLSGVKTKIHTYSSSYFNTVLRYLPSSQHRVCPLCVSMVLEPCRVRLPSTDCSWAEPSMDFDFAEINWSLSLHWLKAAEHYGVDSEGSAGMTAGRPPVGCGWVPEACYLHPRLLWEPVLCGRLLGQVTPFSPPC